MKREERLHYLYIALFILGLILITTGAGNLFGSQVDWLSQHTAFPDYFRKLFYDTGNLFPDFALNIGAGQNIYMFSYYGLLNPILMLSYLFPFLSMADYIMGANTILMLATGMLFYRFLKHQKFESKLCLFTTLIFVTSTCLIFQFHRHFMFVDYLPFLLLGLMGVDSYFEKGHHMLYVGSAFLMIMTSYYYSVTGLVVMVIYAIYQYIKRTDKITLQSFFKEGFKFALPMLISVLMAGILLVPTLQVILGGRTDAGIEVSLLSLFVPDINLDGILYSSYSLGFTALVLFTLIGTMLHKKKEVSFLSISFLVILMIPLFVYLFNGTLYIRDKILIPFLPLIGLLLAFFFCQLKEKEVKTKWLYGATALITVGAFFFTEQTILFYIDMMAMWILLFLYTKYQLKKTCIVTLIIISTATCIVANKQEIFVTTEKYDRIYSSEKNDLISKTLEQEKGLYRFHNLDDTLYTANTIYQVDYYQASHYSSTYHKDYRNFYDNVFKNAMPYRNNLIVAQTKNPLYQTFMGVKYIVTNKTVPIGYEKIDTKNKTHVYQNNNVLPLGYVNRNTIKESVFDSIAYPYSNEVLLTHTVVKNSKNTTYNSSIRGGHVGYTLSKDNKDIEIKKTSDGYEVIAHKTGTIELTLDKNMDQKILFLSMHLKEQPNCTKGDLRITINDTMNKLTCKEWIYQNENHTFEYALSNIPEGNKITMNIEKGVYKLNQIKFYEMDYQNVLDDIKEKDAFIIDKKKTKGNDIVGTIDVKEQGMFTTSIPYDEGFTVFLDGKKINYEKVNKAFLGFELEKGNHQIEIEYKAPGKDIGMFLSIFGVAGMVTLIYFDYKRKDMK